uniref:Homing endonuclease LAGLIDADG domain-containing protein n=2 Tax=Chlorogonium TaxID=52027 RepID=Q8WL12_9CHLO|nr:putative protein [Chlorogonium elongatum]ALO21368.1 putative LAGLIDADG homing endonuclease [Chlorogonium capillatum]
MNSSSENRKFFFLNPGEKLPEDIVTKLKQINDSFSKHSDFSRYKREIKELFQIAHIFVTEDSKRFLGGFLEGEASLNVSAKKLTNAKFGLLIDPEFSITQHVNGISNLYLALEVFQTGRISLKNGSNATMVFKIDNRQNLQQKVVPFYETYVNRYGSPNKKARVVLFLQLLDLFNQKGHENLQVFVEKMLPIWDKMRMQKGQSNEAFPDLDTAQRYVKNFWHNKNNNLT